MSTERLPISSKLKSQSPSAVDVIRPKKLRKNPTFEAFTHLKSPSANGLPNARPTCLACFRPSAHCVCNLLKVFTAHCNILILQHPHERRKYYSTAKLVQRSIQNSRLLRGVEFDASRLAAELSAKGGASYLLFPGDDSASCEDLHLELSDTVVVLDGTWSEAGKILRRNPILQNLPKVSFKQNLVSQYKIRKQPKPTYLSTLESITQFLKLNAAGSGNEEALRKLSDYDTLMIAFGAMVDKQLGYFPRFNRQGVSFESIEGLCLLPENLAVQR